MLQKVVTDANIIFASLHTANSQTRRKLLTASFRFVSPNFIFEEIFDHKERIFKNAKATPAEIKEYLHKILQKIYFYNEELISTGNFFEAYHLCKDVDLDDLVYVALSLELNAPLWTRDETLKAGLRAKGFDNFFDENYL